jgi:hypothetical protein
MTPSLRFPLAQGAPKALATLRSEGFSLSMQELLQAALSAESQLGSLRGRAMLGATFQIPEGAPDPKRPIARAVAQSPFFAFAEDDPIEKSVAMALRPQGWTVEGTWSFGRQAGTAQFVSCEPARLFDQLAGQQGETLQERKNALDAFSLLLNEKLFSIDQPLPGLDSLRDHDVLTPLGRACLLSSLPLARQMLQLGADPNAPSLRGTTPLEECLNAPMSGAEDCVRLLLQAGADPRIPGPEGSPAWTGRESGANAGAALLIQAAARSMDEAEALGQIANPAPPRHAPGRI